MPVSDNGQLKTISVIVTRAQETELRKLQEVRSSEFKRASFAQVVREVVAAGLDSISCTSDMDIDTSDVTSERERVPA